MKVPVLCCALIVALPLLGQSAGHRVAAYATNAEAMTHVNSETVAMVPVRYQTEYGTFVSYLVVDQPVFADTCDVAGASGTNPTVWTGTLSCGSGLLGSVSQSESSLANVQTFIATLTSQQKTTVSFRRMVGNQVFPHAWVVEYQTFGGFCQ